MQDLRPTVVTQLSGQLRQCGVISRVLQPALYALFYGVAYLRFLPIVALVVDPTLSLEQLTIHCRSNIHNSETVAQLQLFPRRPVVDSFQEIIQ